jgi:hypothetical protein
MPHTSQAAAQLTYRINQSISQHTVVFYTPEPVLVPVPVSSDACDGANTGAVSVPVPDTLGMSYIVLGRNRALRCMCLSASSHKMT